MLTLEAAFRAQAEICSAFESGLYACLLQRCAEDIETGGPVAALLADFRGDPLREALPLKLLAAVHESVLSGRAEELARCYPSVGGIPDCHAVWPVFCEFVRRDSNSINDRIPQPLQTNEVGRSSVLLGGFLRICRLTQLPLRLYELGASAGLNLRWDSYYYRLANSCWGNDRSLVHLKAAWKGPAALTPLKPIILVRHGCDLRPPDLRDPAERLRLRACVWADQPERLAVLEAAIDAAMMKPPHIEKAGAADWIERQIHEGSPGSVEVVFHSVVWPYLSDTDQARIQRRLETEGSMRKQDRPLAWLRLEDGPPATLELRLKLWPPGKDELLARAQPHGRWIEWLAME